eukprot:TRINITY_DN4763_c0_g1_i7.p1 TRINITY_DN4763_c0_g1~~TRINITY_DN4763_c0_g1_i7.p1  ORF type:complete len:588 (-),score=12.87 TRINITY_DN4763_c0_g1_i7:5760-7523(-)
MNIRRIVILKKENMAMQLSQSRTSFIVVTIAVQLISVVSSVHVPECGDIEDIRWDSDCLLSSPRQRQSLLHDILVIKNLLIYDGRFFFNVKPRTSEELKTNIRQNLERHSNGELTFEVRNVSRSPLIFGKPSTPSPYTIEHVKEFNSSIIFHSQNLKEHVLRQYRNTTEQFVPSSHIYNILCKVLGQCQIDDEARSQTLLVNTVFGQSRMDYDNGVRLFCFSQQGLFPLALSSVQNSTLYILRKAVLYTPRNTFHPKQIILNHDVQDRCVEQGFAYDKSGQIQKQKAYDISICAIFRDEDKVMLEWVAYHLMIGIQHFFLYNDHSTDESLEVLQPLVQNQLVTLLHRSEINASVEVEYEQQEAWLRFCGDTFGNTSKWLLSIDLDEYLVIKGAQYNNSLLTWLSYHPELITNTGAIEIPRENFAGNYFPLNYTQLLIGELIYKMPLSVKNHDTKTMANTNGLEYLYTHWSYTFKPLRNGKLEETCFLRQQNNSDCMATDALSIFHYTVKSYESCMRKANATLWKHSWRVTQGEEFCNSMIFGYKNEPQLWSQDRYLANPTVIGQVCNKMKELNAYWYEKHNSCGYYV